MVLVTPNQGPGPHHHHITGRGHLIRAGSHSLAITALGPVTEDLPVQEEGLLHLEAMDHQEEEEDPPGLVVDHIEVMDHQGITHQDISLDITLHQDMVHHDTTPHQAMVPQDTGHLVVTMAEVVTDIAVVLLDTDHQDSEDEEDHTPGVGQ